MVRENDLVVIFHSVHRVMKAEKVLKEAGADILLIPVPRQLSSDCGLAIRSVSEQRERVEEILKQNELTPAEWYRRRGEGYEPL